MLVERVKKKKNDMTKFAITCTGSCAKNMVIEHWRPDIVVINWTENECKLIYLAIPTDYNIKDQRLF